MGVSAYFPLLMKFLRSHILRISIVALLLSGFALHFLQPSQSNSSTQAFASWLTAMAKQPEMSEIGHELDQLRRSGDQLSQILQRASQIVSENNKEFNFAFQDHVASQNIYQLLLIEWNQFKTENTMADIPVRPVIKPLLPLNFDKIGTFLSKVTDSSNTLSVFWDMMQEVSERAYIKVAVVPMIGGIAIGAP